MKKVISIILATVLVFTSFSVLASAKIIENDATLQFNEDGKFKILHVCDIQDTWFTASQALDYIAATCDAEKPDLVVLGGDNIHGYAGDGITQFTAELKVKIAIDHYMSIFEERNIPTAIVFGNHDGEEMVSKEAQIEMYKKYNCFIGYIIIQFVPCQNPFYSHFSTNFTTKLCFIWFHLSPIPYFLF